MQAHDTERTKYDARDYAVTCVQCGLVFEATRSDASFCSARCRVSYGRQEQKLNNSIAWIETIGRQMLSLAVRYKHNKRVFEAMSKLHVAIGKAVVIFEVGE